jgi:hypothetical protein
MMVTVKRTSARGHSFNGCYHPAEHMSGQLQPLQALMQQLHTGLSNSLDSYKYFIKYLVSLLDL